MMVLVVDDEVDLAEVISFEVEQLGPKTKTATSVEMALKIIDKNKIDLVISDVRMPGEGGLDLLKKIKAIHPNLPVILISGFADATDEEAVQMGAEVLLSKPMGVYEISKWVKKILKL